MKNRHPVVTESVARGPKLLVGPAGQIRFEDGPQIAGRFVQRPPKSKGQFIRFVSTPAQKRRLDERIGDAIRRFMMKAPR